MVNAARCIEKWLMLLDVRVMAREQNPHSRRRLSDGLPTEIRTKNAKMQKKVAKTFLFRSSPGYSVNECRPESGFSYQVKLPTGHRQGQNEASTEK